MGTCYTLKFNKDKENHDYDDLMKNYKQSLANTMVLRKLDLNKSIMTSNNS